jgi:predicted nucleotide-binding protein (sugar kinase/HSP70/actin superfamily)
MEEKGRIGIPKALMFYRYLPLWQTFFEELGWTVVVSEGLGKNGKIVYFEDSCLPMKLLVTHAIQLKDRVDHLFVPRIMSLHQRFIMCPKFRGVPDIVRLATDGKRSIIDETIDLQKRESSLPRAFMKIACRLGSSEKEGKKAFVKAERFLTDFKKRWVDRINLLPSNQLFDFNIPTPPPIQKGTNDLTPSLRVAFVGHPYNLFDTDINKDVLGLAKGLGMEIATSDDLSETMIDKQVSDLSKEIYWSSGREIAGSLFHFLSSGVDGVIFLTSFKCGIDALLQELIKRKLKITGGQSVPFLILSFDEHTGREGLTTRLEAFRDVMEEQRRLRHSEDKAQLLYQ